jgi:hypothetical protein
MDRISSGWARARCWLLRVSSSGACSLPTSSSHTRQRAVPLCHSFIGNGNSRAARVQVQPLDSLRAGAFVPTYLSPTCPGYIALPSSYFLFCSIALLPLLVHCHNYSIHTLPALPSPSVTEHIRQHGCCGRQICRQQILEEADEAVFQKGCRE